MGVPAPREVLWGDREGGGNTLRCQAVLTVTESRPRCPELPGAGLPSRPRVGAGRARGPAGSLPAQALFPSLPLLFCGSSQLFGFPLPGDRTGGVVRPREQTRAPARPVLAPASLSRVSHLGARRRHNTLSESSCNVLSRVFLCPCDWQAEKRSLSACHRGRKSVVHGLGGRNLHPATP